MIFRNFAHANSHLIRNPPPEVRFDRTSIHAENEADFLILVILYCPFLSFCHSQKP